MKPPEANAVTELRVLIVAPVGRDADVACELLRQDGICCHALTGIAELRPEIARGVGAILLSTEALAAEDAAEELQRLLDEQEPWSDIPVVIAAAPGASRDPDSPLAWRGGAVTILERPIRVLTLQTVVRSALRARRRQYQMRELLAELRVNVDRLEEERSVRERFVALLAHDLRGPLSAASMAAGLLVRRGDSGRDPRDLALRIERSTVRMDRMIRDLLDANRLRAGHRLPLDLQPCDFVEIVADVVAELDDASRARVQVLLPERLEGVWAPDQLRRAVWNLTTNALKYGTPDTPVGIELRRTAEAVIVSVHNEGDIPGDDQARLFEPFRRSRDSEGRSRGWGLGLTLVRGCAEAHGGELELSSTADAGTTFTLRLPLDARPYQLRDPSTVS